MDIVAVGNALFDIIAFVDETFVPSLGFVPGQTIHVPVGELAGIIPRLPRTRGSAGGGAANMARAASLLGLKTTFLGAIGLDDWGRKYREGLGQAGVEARLLECEGETGIFLALLEPSGRRTVLVAPGCARAIASKALEYDRRPGALLYFDGFLLGSGSFFAREAQAARAAGMKVALDLGSRRLVEAMRQELLGMVGLCDFIFANEDEFLAFAGEGSRIGPGFGADSDCVFVVKKAERGAVFLQRGRAVESPVRAQKPLDETGAGDAFAAGFLSGVAHGYPPERCLRMGNRIAEEAISVAGMNVTPGRIQAAQASVRIAE